MTLDGARALLRHSPLGDRVVSTCEGGPRTAYVVKPLSDDHGLEDWHIARALWPQSGLWPLLAPSYMCERWYTPEYVDDAEETIETASRHPWPDDIPHAVVGKSDWPSWVSGAAEGTRYYYGDAPSAAELLRQVPNPDRLSLERRLFEWEEKHSATAAVRPGVFDFRPDSFDSGTALLLLPIPAPWTLPIFLDVLMAGHYTSEGRGQIGAIRLAAAMRSWLERYRAEPYFTDGLTLRFVVEHPPSIVTEAFVLASELDFFDRTQSSMREFARDLLGSRHWELFDRP